MRNGIRKHLATIIVTSMAAGSVYAVAPGLYMGLALGPATNTGSAQDANLANPNPPPSTISTIEANPRSNQFGSRFFVGYKMNDYFGFEGGFNFYSKIQYDTRNQQTCGDASERIRTIDFTGKATAPLTSMFDVFGKFGVAQTYITNGGAFTNTCQNEYVSKTAPEVGVGVSYDVNQNWVVDASWIRLMVGGIIKNMDFYGIGLSYHFVDKYCGQFLCDD